MDKLTLNNQVTIPLTGLGVYQINNLDECEHTVLNALKMGYRLIDTAACYGNEKAVGKAIKKVKFLVKIFLYRLKFGYKMLVTKRQNNHLLKH